MRKIDINFKKLIELRGVPLTLAATILVTGLSGCSKKAECDVDNEHAHLYINEGGYIAWYDKEYLEYDGYTRQDEYIPLDEDNSELIKFLDKKDLISLDDNLDVILSETEKNHDFVEYRYSYREKITRWVGKVPMKRWVTRYSWTRDANHDDLTGEVRTCHYVYQGCNVYKDDSNKYVVIPSDEVDDIKDLIGNYKYVRKNYYKVVSLNDGKEIDYEDGPNKSKEHSDMYEATEQNIISDEFEGGPRLVKTY